MKVVVSLLLILCIAGCTTIYNPATGRKEYYFINDNTEVMIGRNIANDMLARNKTVDRGRAVSLVENIGERIVKVSDRDYLDYKFYVLDIDQMNAFALPGGYIFVNKGLVDAATKDELAFVLGHEIGHVAARHSIKRLQASLGLSLILSIATRGSSQATQEAVNIVYSVIALGYSRADEFLADSLGVKYAHKAGYNPKGAITLLEKLGKEAKGTPTLVFFSSHPPVTQRIEKIKSKISQLPKRLF